MEILPEPTSNKLCDSGEGVAAVVVARRVGESDMVGRIDQVVGTLFGFAGKIPPEKFSGGGRRRRVVVAGWAAAGGVGRVLQKI
nr:hypothetical protein [Tanacetum cinerariifolium]